MAVPNSTEPSHQNSTFVTPMSSLAVPLIVAVPLMLAPLPGEVRLAVGALSAVVAACDIVKVWPAIVSVPDRELVAVLAATL